MHLQMLGSRRFLTAVRGSALVGNLSSRRPPHAGGVYGDCAIITMLMPALSSPLSATLLPADIASVTNS